jgi:hypothetical protein
LKATFLIINLTALKGKFKADNYHKSQCKRGN